MELGFSSTNEFKGSEGDPEFLLTHTKQLSLVSFFDSTAGNRANFRTHGRQMAIEGQTDVEVDIVT